MKKIQIVGLVLVALAIAALISLMGDMSTYDSIESAQRKEGKFVHIIAKVDTTKPIVYDPIKDPNYLAFTAVDSPTDFEKSSRVVMKGAMQNGRFECKEIVLKCPSKYKDEKSNQL
ncbi:MAG: cytochrome c maturation protein CcmE [Chitinophagaceae bacterium]|nr:cytochrome c maturation protein CcmE [Chitinophagaceae bacterium]